MEAVQTVISIITIIASGFGAYLGVKVAIARLEGVDQRHGDHLAFNDTRIDKLEEIIHKIIEAGLIRPCDSHQRQMLDLERKIHTLEDHDRRHDREQRQTVGD